MYDEAELMGGPDGEHWHAADGEHWHPADEAFERARSQFAALLHEEVLPVVEAGCVRMEAALAALAAGRGGDTDLVVATTAALGELRGTEHRLRQAMEAALDADPDPDLVRQLMVCGRRLSAEGRFSFDFHDTRSHETAPSLERALLHVGLEALENTARHAGATRVRVRLADRLSGVELTVSDNGTGFGLTPSFQPDHLGMRIMDRRASSVGGWVRVEPGLVGGTVVTCWVPLPEMCAARLERDQSAAS